ncbi:class I SAM-dependent methyltransferase [Oceanicoccus sagamiensis]|uniref:SAM-dependent methyltransferase n=1 Tax=Oceanicoccus sagamiensis TaxID=716816 RepID=A0A1X9N7V6_9GAMM|nr:class I SAM-dependent methyltransferase [Oceanicoccus sagamiensis]ARN73766.1 SAM-dependent methyltransferase [Oceanicoccus sagamiensis]
MATVQKHYDDVLAEMYSWMFGGFDAGVEKNTAFFDKHRLSPKRSAVAVDLGAGCGFQAIPLARRGYSVTAIDLDAKLLKELAQHAGQLPILSIQGDLVDFDQSIAQNVELVVCMTDTLLHLESKAKVIALFSKIYSALEPGGTLITTFRDLTVELNDTDRFLPVRSDSNTVFTCFLEYEPDTVKVHDIVYRKSQDQWTLQKSFYRKLRLSSEWVIDQLSHYDFHSIDSETEHGLITIIAQK